MEERLFFFFPPVVLCCRLPDCWSIKIIVMEIDLIDNVPCSHCEQLVPCEHNPETSSKNFSSTNFQSLILVLPFSPNHEKKGCQGRRNPVLSRTSKTGRNVKWGGRRMGSRIKSQGRRDKRGREREGPRH